MAVYIYDGSFEGLLTCIFTAYQQREFPVNIVDTHNSQLDLLADNIFVATDDRLAIRVLDGIDRQTQGKASILVYHMFLSELPGVEMAILFFIKTITGRVESSILNNFANPHILKAAQIDKMIRREVHRMHAFVRFEKIDDIFYSAILPDFNVLPLIGDHFERRYADQAWIIYDEKRHYGLYYNLSETIFVTFDNPVLSRIADSLVDSAADQRQYDYQILWREYFKSVNIQERNNLSLHLRHMPKRYWRQLVEKQN